MKKQSEAELRFARDLRALKIDGWVPEHEFAVPERLWRLDFAWPDRMLAVEIEGVMGQGTSRHQMKDGFEKDCEKYNEAALRGWMVLRFTPRQVRKGTCYAVLERALAIRRTNWILESGSARHLKED